MLVNPVCPSALVDNSPFCCVQLSSHRLLLGTRRGGAWCHKREVCVPQKFRCWNHSPHTWPREPAGGLIIDNSPETVSTHGSV